MRFFFYGTLLDADLRHAVLGRVSGCLQGAPAELPGYEARLAAGRRYPLAVPRRGAALPGIVVALPHRRAVARLVAYEGPEYRLARCSVRLASGRRVTAAVFLAKGRARASPTPWRLDAWRNSARRRRRIPIRPRW